MLFALVCVVTFMAFTGPVSAKETDLSWVQDILKAKEANKDKNRQLAYDIVQGISGDEPETGLPSSQKACRSTVANLEQNSAEDRYPSLLVFVSFSMPMEALKALGQQTNKTGGKIVFRGLVGGSFPKTSEKMRELGVDALVDPTLFEGFGIKAVPAFVMLDRPMQDVDEKPAYDQMTGHVSLHHALETFVKGGNAKASELLLNLKGGRK